MDSTSINYDLLLKGMVQLSKDLQGQMNTRAAEARNLEKEPMRSMPGSQRRFHALHGINKSTRYFLRQLHGNLSLHKERLRELKLLPLWNNPQEEQPSAKGPSRPIASPCDDDIPNNPHL